MSDGQSPQLNLAFVHLSPSERQCSIWASSFVLSGCAVWPFSEHFFFMFYTKEQQNIKMKKCKQIFKNYEPIQVNKRERILFNPNLYDLPWNIK